MELTKQYRLIWVKATKEIVMHNVEPELTSVTKSNLGDELDAFESDELQDVLDKIELEELVMLNNAQQQ